MISLFSLKSEFEVFFYNTDDRLSGKIQIKMMHCFKVYCVKEAQINKTAVS